MNERQFVELLERFSRYLDERRLSREQLSRQDADVVVGRITTEIKNTITVAQDKIGDMNLIPDKPRSIKLAQPGHLESINIQFDPQKLTEIPVVLNKKKLNDDTGLMLPMMLPVVIPPTSNPLPPTSVKPPAVPVQPKPKPTIPKPPVVTKPPVATKPLPRRKTISVDKQRQQQALESKPKQTPKPVVVPEPKPVTVPEPKPVVVPEPKPVTVPEPKPVVVPEPKPVTVPEPKPVPRPKSPTPIKPSVQPKPLVKPPITFKQIELKTFELKPDGTMKFESDLDRAVRRNLTQTSRQSLRLRPSRIPTGAMNAVTGAPAALFFIGISELVNTIRSDQVHEEQKKQVGLTHEFNKYFLEQMDKNPIPASEAIKLQMKQSGMTTPGAISNPISKDQAYDTLVTRRKKEVLDQYYDDVYMPRKEKNYLKSLLRDPTRDSIEDNEMRSLIEKYPDVYRENHQLWTPRQNSGDEPSDKPKLPGGEEPKEQLGLIDPNKQQIDYMYDQVMLALNQPVQTGIPTVSQQTTKYKVVDDYEDIAFVNTDVA